MGGGGEEKIALAGHGWKGPGRSWREAGAGVLGTHEGATLSDQTASRPLLPAPQWLMPEKLGISCPILRP